MGDQGDDARFLAACDECGAVYAATRTSGGDILPIGSRTGCQCGSTSFTPVDGGESGDDEAE